MTSSRELVNRGNNLFLCGFMAVTGLAAVPELATEGGIRGAVDESVVVLLALGAVVWYVRNRYRGSWSVLSFPIGLVAVKVIALLIEDPDDRGDDIGLLITAVILIIVWAVIRWRTREVNAAHALSAAESN